MEKTAFFDDARVMSKGQVTIPKKVRNALGIDTGDRITFVVDGNQVRVVNSTIFSLEQFQSQMNAEVQSASYNKESDISYWFTNESHKEENKTDLSASHPDESLNLRPIGIAKGKFIYPDDFDMDNEEITKLLTEGSL